MAQYTNFTSNTSTGWHRLSSGEAIITAIGNFGGGTLTIEIKNPQGDAAPIEALTDEFTKTVYFPDAVQVRATLVGAAAPDIDFNIWGG